MSMGWKSVAGTVALALIASGAGGAWGGGAWVQKRDAPPSLHAIVYRDLALDADQGVRIEAIEARFAPRRIALEARVQAANRELAAAISASDGDVSVVRPAVDHFHDAIGELQQATITHISEMRMVRRRFRRIGSTGSWLSRFSPRAHERR